MKRFAITSMLVAALFVAVLPSAATANPGAGLGVVAFGCQIKLTFPAQNVAPKTNCDGWANGAAAIATGKPGVIAFTGVPNKLPLGLNGKCQPNCYINLRVDN